MTLGGCSPLLCPQTPLPSSQGCSIPVPGAGSRHSLSLLPRLCPCVPWSLHWELVCVPGLSSPPRAQLTLAVLNPACSSLQSCCSLPIV